MASVCGVVESEGWRVQSFKAWIGDWSVKARLEGCDWFALLWSDCANFRQQWIMDGREGYINLLNHLESLLNGQYCGKTRK